ncbi:restriction endonuclease [Muriicola sp. SD30]|uniref:restriction endonuclease n=1 Tax=Muriicola sp. SD30 TaxID=3240936 RepID=UPI00351044CD
MGRRQKDGAIVLLFVIGIIGAILLKIFEGLLMILDALYQSWYIWLPVVLVTVVLAIIFKRLKKEMDEKNDFTIELAKKRKSLEKSYVKYLEKSIALIEYSLQEQLLKLDQINQEINSQLISGLSYNETENSQNEINDSPENIIRIKNILQDIDSKSFKIWDDLKDKNKFEGRSPEIRYKKSILKIDLIDKPSEPDYSQSFKELTLPKKYMIDPINQFQDQIKSNVSEGNERIEKLYNDRLELLKSKKKSSLDLLSQLQTKYDKSKEDFYNKRRVYNEKIENIRIDYFDNNIKAIEFYCEKILDKIEYYEKFEKSNNVGYNDINKILLVEYLLPDIEDFPVVKEVRFLKTKNEYKNIHLTQKELKELYDETLYKICLSLIYYLFKSDEIDAIESIVFNGVSNSIDRSIGKRRWACIMTVHCNKKEFLEIELDKVYPKDCFKKLKGISAPNLTDLVPIKPIQILNKDDKRFVIGEYIEVDSRTNLASMDWKDFEHLIREIFEKEFTVNGGEVRVTQSSRDGGVDAIAHDPDPIKGGKIVIQAKRYTNTVGVNSVRELYGILQDEGAMKGIIVTTSDYGKDAYDFAKDKPLTLLNGANLLSLLHSHNYNAKIDIAQAKLEIEEGRINSEDES